MRLQEAIILAGGLGTRLRSMVEEQPKSMAPINGRPFLEYLLDHLIAQGINRCIFSVGYKATHITDHFGDCYRDCSIVYAHEEEPLGTGGAIQNALSLTSSETVLITNGDSLFRVPIQEQFALHQNKGADVTLALRPMTDFSRYGTVELGADQRILAFKEKMPVTAGLINGGVYIFQTNTLAKVSGLPTKFSIERDLFEAQVDQLRFFGFIANDYFLDIGIPADFTKAQDEFKQFTPRS